MTYALDFLAGAAQVFCMIVFGIALIWGLAMLE